MQGIGAREDRLRPTVSSLGPSDPDRALQHVIPMIPPATSLSARIAGVRGLPAELSQQTAIS
jgi:hypothetical protein